jgi:DNA-binding transcriptional MerR regulator
MNDISIELEGFAMADWDELERRFREHQAAQNERMSVPKFTTKILTRRLNVPSTTLTNWLTRKVFDLDADRYRQPNSSRLFSTRDVLLLAFAARLAAFGMPTEAIKRLCDWFISGGQLSAVTVMNSTSASRSLVIFPKGDGWIAGEEFVDDEGRARFAGADLMTGGSVELVGPEIPGTRLVIIPRQVLLDVLGALGETVVTGSAEAMRQAAAKTERRSK